MKIERNNDYIETKKRNRLLLLLETELEAAQKAAQYHRKWLRELRTELSSAVGLAELGKKHGTKAAEYLEKIQNVLSNLLKN